MSGNLSFNLLGKDEYACQEIWRRILNSKLWLTDVYGLIEQDWDPARDNNRQSMYEKRRRRLQRVSCLPQRPPIKVFACKLHRYSQVRTSIYISINVKYFTIASMLT